MLYTFKSGATGELIMLKEPAEQVLFAINKIPEPQGVIDPADLPEAIEKLQAAMQISRQQAQPAQDAEQEKHNHSVPFHTPEKSWAEICNGIKINNRAVFINTCLQK